LIDNVSLLTALWVAMEKACVVIGQIDLEAWPAMQSVGGVDIVQQNRHVYT
jgi:hypothetical protein